jgi:hypothetical protein
MHDLLSLIQRLITLPLLIVPTFLAAGQPEPIVRMIDPQTVDAQASGGNGFHLTAFPQSGQSGFLVLFFPGTGASPDDYSILLEHLAQGGHHVIGLSYRNEGSVNFVYCPGQVQTDCPEEVRTEILTGQDSSPLLTIDEPNSAYGRARRLLGYLDQAYPNESWSEFLDGGQIAWDRIIVSGQSQGGGHAALSAKWHRVERTVLFSATEPAPWTQGPSQTGVDAFFGIVHASELNANGIKNSWLRLGLPGNLQNIDNVTPPYNQAHRLETNRLDCSGDPESNGFFHNCTSADDWLPPADSPGREAMSVLWNYLFALTLADQLFASRFESP